MNIAASLFALTVAAVATAAVPAPTAAAENDTIVIEAAKLEPPILKTATERRVTFVNRSGRPAHVDFVGAAGEHRVFQVPGEIWAIFHRPGVHTYVVHLERGANVVTLRGAVEAVDEPDVSHPTCDDLTVMGVCIER